MKVLYQVAVGHEDQDDFVMHERADYGAASRLARDYIAKGKPVLVHRVTYELVRTHLPPEMTR